MTSHKQTLEVQYVPVGDLKENTYNPKRFDKEALDGIRESVNRFGFADPLVVNSNENRKNILIGGHARLKIAKELGFETVPVVFVNLTEDKEKELNLRLHKKPGSVRPGTARQVRRDLAFRHRLQLRGARRHLRPRPDTRAL
jgi:ParB-like chromosome segregation protein Spo0J